MSPKCNTCGQNEPVGQKADSRIKKPVIRDAATESEVAVTAFAPLLDLLEDIADASSTAEHHGLRPSPEHEGPRWE